MLNSALPEHQSPAYQRGLADEINGIDSPPPEFDPQECQLWRRGYQTSSFYNLARMERPDLQERPLE